ncbi:hypothetical protein RE474_00500 [Methanolobus sediminis]|uniref:Uncharacterized protein n=1 Tax=Methanolobus sediminis TaxID=3072978 RepID=A0AA51UMW2_9EURY|nr:hypothetical protein [Methanolobus sediminis]WMW25231.1 hypothetical protein RE474_00500 [Methanolobus sediminis]
MKAWNVVLLYMQLICLRTINNDFGEKIRAGDIIDASNKDSIVDKKKTGIKNNMVDFINHIFTNVADN